MALDTTRDGGSRPYGVSFRMNEEDYLALRAEVAADGYKSLQALLEVRVFGEIRPHQKTGRRPKQRQEDTLDLSA